MTAESERLGYRPPATEDKKIDQQSTGREVSADIFASASSTIAGVDQPGVLVDTRRKPIRTIIVGNNREYFSPIGKFFSEFDRDCDADQADMGLMWKGDNKIVLLPRKVDTEFTSDVSRLFGFKNTNVLVPNETEAELSEDTIKDVVVFRALRNEIVRSEDIQVIPFGHTPQFNKLIGKLRDTGAQFKTPETSTEVGIRAEGYFETKVGSRDLMFRVQSKHPELGIKIPEGFVCENVEEALAKVDHFLGSGRGVVFKANYGASGMGVYIYKPEQLDTKEKINVMQTKLSEDPLFKGNKIVVEERIDSDFGHHGTYPSVDAIVKEDGSVEVKAVDAMVIQHDGEGVDFYGCVAGKGLFREDQIERLRAFTTAVGEELSIVGYRGWYDTDYILAKDGKFSPTEANLRRTNMCHVIDLAKHLFGDNWEEIVSVRTNDDFIRKNLDGVNYSQLKGELSEIMFPIGQVKEGVIISQSIRSRFGQGKFGYTIFGDGQDRTKEIEQMLEAMVDKIHVRT